MTNLIKAIIIAAPVSYPYSVGQETSFILSTSDHKVGQEISFNNGLSIKVTELPVIDEESYEAHKSRHIEISHRNGVE
jgi:hypothetical protein